MNVWGGECLGWWTSDFTKGMVNVWGGERLRWWTSGVVNVWGGERLGGERLTIAFSYSYHHEFWFCAVLKPLRLWIDFHIDHMKNAFLLCVCSYEYVSVSFQRNSSCKCCRQNVFFSVVSSLVEQLNNCFVKMTFNTQHNTLTWPLLDWLIFEQTLILFQVDT